jgi:hypothetical protein
MKTIFLCAAFLCSSALYSQDVAQVKRIDSLVGLINNSDYKIQRDTIKQDRPEIGLSMQTYLTMVSSGSELKKYVNNVHVTTQENGATKQRVATNAFYFDQNKLIKVEEFMTEGDKKNGCTLVLCRR